MLVQDQPPAARAALLGGEQQVLATLHESVRARPEAACRGGRGGGDLAAGCRGHRVQGRLRTCGEERQPAVGAPAHHVYALALVGPVQHNSRRATGEPAHDELGCGGVAVVLNVGNLITGRGDRRLQDGPADTGHKEL